MCRRKWLIGLIGVLLMAACNKEYMSNIPDAPVNLTCDLKNNFFQITTPSQFVMVTKIAEGYLISFPNKPSLAVKTQKAQYARLGYAGLIVGNSPFNGYCAFDAACPVEGNAKFRLMIKDDGLGMAVCAKCGSVFDLNNGGIPIKGESREGLKRYSTSLVSGGTELNVFN